MPPTPSFQPPRVDLREPQNLSSGTLAELISGAEGLRFEGFQLQDEDLRGTSWVECVLENVGIFDADLSALTVAESSLRSIHAPHLRAPRSSWREVHIGGSRVGAAELYESVLDSVQITGCKLDLVNLRGAKLTDVVFDSCTIGELDLTAASVRRIQFRSCQVETLVLSQAALAHADLRGAQLNSLVGMESLRGAVISPSQLADLSPRLAEHMGLKVLDD